MDKNEFKKMIIRKWASSDLSVEQIMDYCKHPSKFASAIEKLDRETKMCKSAIISDAVNKFGNVLNRYFDVFYKYVPAISFGIPLIGGSALYMVTHADDVKEENAKKRRDLIRDMADKEFEEKDLSKLYGDRLRYV